MDKVKTDGWVYSRTSSEWTSHFHIPSLCFQKRSLTKLKKNCLTHELWRSKPTFSRFKRQTASLRLKVSAPTDPAKP